MKFILRKLQSSFMKFTGESSLKLFYHLFKNIIECIFVIFIFNPYPYLHTIIPLFKLPTTFVSFLILVLLFCFFLFYFQDKGSFCSPCCHGTHSVDQAGLKLRNPPASASQMLGLMACATTPGYKFLFKV